MSVHRHRVARSDDGYATWSATVGLPDHIPRNASVSVR